MYFILSWEAIVWILAEKYTHASNFQTPIFIVFDFNAKYLRYILKTIIRKKFILPLREAVKCFIAPLNNYE